MVVTTQHTKVRRAMTGMASHTGRSGLATSPPIIHCEMGTRKKMCIRYMPNENLARLLIHEGARLMQVNSRKAPKVASNTFGVQNSQDHSSIGVSIITPGSPFHQKLQAVKAPPTMKQRMPTFNRFPSDQFM